MGLLFKSQRHVLTQIYLSSPPGYFDTCNQVKSCTKHGRLDQSQRKLTVALQIVYWAQGSFQPWLGQILNLTLPRWPQRIGGLSVVGNITIKCWYISAHFDQSPFYRCSEMQFMQIVWRFSDSSVIIIRIGKRPQDETALYGIKTNHYYWCCYYYHY